MIFKSNTPPPPGKLKPKCRPGKQDFRENYIHITHQGKSILRPMTAEYMRLTHFLFLSFQPISPNFGDIQTPPVIFFVFFKQPTLVKD
jgi:hypothetical protein